MDGYIETDESLRTLRDRLMRSPWVALDTEFVRERTYYAQLCLLQVADAEGPVCIDVQAIADLTPLYDVLFAEHIVKIVHAARQDFEVLYWRCGQVPGPIFDTQLAATLLYGIDQIGYASLVDRVFGVHLDKAHTRTDWSRRPLHSDAIHYALDDVRYLGPLYLRMRDELAVRGQLDWLAEDLAALADPTLYQPNALEVWRRIKDARRLRGVQLAALQQLAAWREQVAIDRDRPRKWIVADELLAEIARRMPGSAEALAQIRGLGEQWRAADGAAALECVARARALPPEQWPVLPRAEPLTPNQEALLEMLQACVRLCAEAAGLPPALLASRADLEGFLRGQRQWPRGWRAALLAGPLQDLFAGERWLGIAEGRAVLVRQTELADSQGASR